MPLGILIPIFPVTEDFGPLGHLLFDLLIQAGEKFTNRSPIYRLIRQRRPKAWLAGELFVAAHFGPLIFALEAQQKSRFLLPKREAVSIGSQIICKVRRRHDGEVNPVRVQSYTVGG